MKKVRINSIQDILDNTNIKNIDNFLSDLKGLMTMLYLARVTDPNVKVIHGMDWINDNKNNINLTITNDNCSICDSKNVDYLESDPIQKYCNDCEHIDIVKTI